MVRYLGKILDENMEFGKFKPFISYHKEMGFYIYLNKDCSYRAHRIDNTLEILYDPYSDEIVGVKINAL